MSVILVRDPDQQALVGKDEGGFWPVTFDKVLDVSVDDALAGYDVVIPADGLRDAPRQADSTRVALHCARLEALEHLVTIAGNADVVFSPSLLTRLDRHRALRATLKAARAMDAGHRITERDLASETGGAGMAADLQATVIGRALVYDLPAGSAIDFGMIGERGEGPA